MTTNEWPSRIVVTWTHALNLWYALYLGFLINSSFQHVPNKFTIIILYLPAFSSVFWTKVYVNAFHCQLIPIHKHAYAAKGSIYKYAILHFFRDCTHPYSYECKNIAYVFTVPRFIIGLFLLVSTHSAQPNAYKYLMYAYVVVVVD